MQFRLENLNFQNAPFYLKASKQTKYFPIHITITPPSFKVPKEEFGRLEEEKNWLF